MRYSKQLSRLNFPLFLPYLIQKYKKKDSFVRLIWRLPQKIIKKFDFKIIAKCFFRHFKQLLFSALLRGGGLG